MSLAGTTTYFLYLVASLLLMENLQPWNLPTVYVRAYNNMHLSNITAQWITMENEEKSLPFTFIELYFSIL